MTEWIGAAEAARRLGVKPASLYSYVSRGVLTRRRNPGDRASLFSASEVDRLARRGRPRRPPAGAETVVETALTEIAGDRLRYRGIDVTGLAATASFEQVADLLWTGASPGPERPASPADPASPAASGSGLTWRAAAEAVAAGRIAQSALPAGTLPLERLQVIVPALAAADPLRLHLEPAAVTAAARTLIAGMVDCLPVPGGGAATSWPGRADGGPDPGPIAARLAAKLTAEPLPPALVDALRAALILLADHELAASTFAARVAASVRADPYAVVATGLGVMGGALHGGASLGAEVMLAAADAPADAPRVVGDLLRRGERIPGLGHLIYRSGDPRAVLLLDLVRAAAPESDRLAVADAVLAEVGGRGLPAPNIDLALAALTSVAGMTPGAGEVIFAIARTAGWIAHALEEYARNIPIRPRAIYTGPTVASG